MGAAPLCHAAGGSLCRLALRPFGRTQEGQADLGSTNRVSTPPEYCAHYAGRKLDTA